MADQQIVRESASGTGPWTTKAQTEAGGGGGVGTVTEITSTDMSVTITDPTGPVVDLSAGGGSQPGTVIPVADSTDVVVDTTTYENTILGDGFFTTLVFPDATGAIAIAVDGDAFPRFVLDPADGIYLGDGTVDIAEGAQIQSEAGDNGPILYLYGGGSSRSIVVGAESFPDIGSVTSSSLPLRLNNGVVLHSGVGAPTARGGVVGNLYFRTDPGGANETIYRCTVAGDAGNATWVGIL